jgi:hypothetical protein
VPVISEAAPKGISAGRWDPLYQYVQQGSEKYLQAPGLLSEFLRWKKKPLKSRRVEVGKKGNKFPFLPLH